MEIKDIQDLQTLLANLKTWETREVQPRVQNITSWWGKALPYIIGIFLLSVLGIIGLFIYSLSQQIKTQNQQIQQQLTLFGNTISGMNIRYVDKNEMKAMLDDQLKALLESKKQTPTGHTSTSSHVPGSSGTTPIKPGTVDPETFLYWPKNKLNQQLLLGRAKYLTSQSAFETETYPIKVDVTTTMAVDKKDLETTYVTIIAKDKDDNPYVLDVNEMTTNKVYPKTNSWQLAPHIDGGGSAVFAGRPQVGISLGISPFAYGLTKDDNLIRIPRLSISGNEESGWMSIQGQYNLFKQVPAIPLKDTWIGVGPAINSEGKLGVSIDLTSTF